MVFSRSFGGSRLRTIYFLKVNMHKKPGGPSQPFCSTGCFVRAQVAPSAVRPLGRHRRGAACEPEVGGEAQGSPAGGGGRFLFFFKDSSKVL